jgi:hypothetical protein
MLKLPALEIPDLLQQLRQAILAHISPVRVDIFFRTEPTQAGTASPPG